MKSLRIYCEFGGKNVFVKNLHTGILIDYSTNTVYDKQSNPFLINSSITGHGGGVLTGLGVLLVLDRRDNIFYPSQKYYYKFRWTRYGRHMGSAFTYNRFVFDLRNYYSIWPTHIIALNLYGDLTTGSPPFFRLPALGGDEHMRGFFYGRYRDHHYLTGQVEYRKIVWWRIGTALFFSAGDVAPRLRDFNLDELKYSYGFGLRFVFDKEEKVNVRMDLGFGKKTSGIYFALEEAF
jgi:outer membrane protein assembly factor BamA